MRKTLPVLIGLQIVATVACVFVALFEPDSIYFTGPTLAGLGLVITAIAYACSLKYGLYFGLSWPSVVIFGGALLYGCNTMPHDEYGAVCVLLFAFAQPTVIWLGIMASKESRQPRPVEKLKPMLRIRFQFRLGMMMQLVTVTAIAVACFRIDHHEEMHALGVVVIYSFLLSHFLWRFHRLRTSDEIEVSNNKVALRREHSPAS